ncbi:MAG: ZIP family metal transporter [Bacteroidetes bacterium]|nr:ZIP family metal transporter [Bacteroidota bacterium]
MPSLFNISILFLFPLMGGLMALYTRKDWKNAIKLFLAFSGAFLFAITFLNFIPEVYHHLDNAGIWVLAGFFFQIFIEQFTKGIEHGHSHVHDIKSVVPIFIGLGIHAFLEGIPLGSQNSGITNGLLYGVALHEMPAAFVLAISLKALMPNKNILPYIIAYALFCPAGATLGYYVEHIEHGDRLFMILLAFVSGTFLHISTTILFENSEEHKISRRKLIAVLIGTALAMLTMLI